MATQITPFGTRPDGQDVAAVALQSDCLSATILTQGAVLQSLYLTGIDHSLTLGFPDLAPYLGGFSSFGAIIAPVANRIANARAEIAGRTCRFDANAGTATLHSGAAGSHHALWTLADHGPAHVTLTLHQPDGEGGFPGNRDLTATYRLEADTLALDVTAATDAPTLMNVAHHGYWNLDGSPTWAGHVLTVHADRILVTDVDNLPTGKIRDLAGHPHDFRQEKRIAPGDIPPLDHNFCLAPGRRELTPALRLTGTTGVSMEIATTEPGLQIFDAGPIHGGDHATIHGRPYPHHSGLAIEPQFWPDAPNHTDFPSIDLAPGQPWHQRTTWRFSAPA